jgi:hypothetical protein
VDSIVLYSILVMALALFLAGAYGAAPVLFGRRQAAADGDAARLFALSNAFALLRHDTTDFAEASSAQAIAGSPRPPSRGEGDPEDSLVPLEGDPGEQEELLTDLFAEIGMLRLQIEGLRRELGGLALSAAPAARRPPSPGTAEPRRRAKAGSAAGLPPSLRQRLGDVRRRRSDHTG